MKISGSRDIAVKLHDSFDDSLRTKRGRTRTHGACVEEEVLGLREVRGDTNTPETCTKNRIPDAKVYIMTSVLKIVT